MPIIDPKRERTVIDTETTGFYVADGERIASLGAVKGTLEGGVSGMKSWIVDTEGRQSAPGAMRVHRLRVDDERRLPESFVIPALREFVGDSVAVFQNAPFDMSFLDDSCDRLGLPRFTFEVEDTVVMGRERFPGGQVNLDSLLKKLGVDEGEVSRQRARYHDVLGDCILTFEVWRRLATPGGLDLMSFAAPGPAARAGGISTVAMEW